MRRNICWRSSTLVVATFVRLSLSITVAIAGSSLASHANSMERTTLSQEAPDQMVSGQEEMPLDAFGYLGGLVEARFYEPHSTTGNPRDEIRQAASLYGLDRKSTRLNSSHVSISYAVFCLKKKKFGPRVGNEVKSTYFDMMNI